MALVAGWVNQPVLLTPLANLFFDVGFPEQADNNDNHFMIAPKLRESQLLVNRLMRRCREGSRP